MKRTLPAVFAILSILLFVLSCSAPSSYVQKEPVKGVYHRVKKNETFWSIANAYHIKIQDLAEINNISNPSLVEEGAVLFIPEAIQVIDDVITAVKTTDAGDKAAVGIDSAAKIKPSREDDNGQKIKSPTEKPKGSDKKASPLVPEKEKVMSHGDATAIETAPPRKLTDEKIERKSKTKSSAEEKEELQFEKKRFIWPVRGSVKTRFGIQPNKNYHNWIKIVSVAGTAVKAAASGEVIFSSALPPFGETIIIRHADSFTTVYTHLKKRRVKVDQNIKKGDVIALIGETDEAGDAYMNFEVRWNRKPRNPLFFLP